MYARTTAGTRVTKRRAGPSGCHRTMPRSSPPSWRCPATTGWSPTAPETTKRQAPGWREPCNRPAGRRRARWWVDGRRGSTRGCRSSRSRGAACCAPTGIRQLERHRCSDGILLFATLRHGDTDDAPRIRPDRMHAVRVCRQPVVIPDERATEPDVGIGGTGADQELLAETLAAHRGRKIGVEQPVPRCVIALLKLDLHDAVLGDGDPRIHLVGGREIAVYDRRGAPRRAAVRRATEPDVRIPAAVISPDDVHRALGSDSDGRKRINPPAGVLERAATISVEVIADLDDVIDADGMRERVAAVQ